MITGNIIYTPLDEFSFGEFSCTSLDLLTFNYSLESGVFIIQTCDNRCSFSVCFLLHDL